MEGSGDPAQAGHTRPSHVAAARILWSQGAATGTPVEQPAQTGVTFPPPHHWLELFQDSPGTDLGLGEATLLPCGDPPFWGGGCPTAMGCYKGTRWDEYLDHPAQRNKDAGGYLRPSQVWRPRGWGGCGWDPPRPTAGAASGGGLKSVHFPQRWGGEERQGKG